MLDALLNLGWMTFPTDPDVLAWVRAARHVAMPLVTEPSQQRQWLQCEGTWFVGVDTLPNSVDGAVEGSGPLCGDAYFAATRLYGDIPLHRAQVSVVYPGYPKPRKGEGESAFRYRLTRDAAHVDGLHATGPDRLRMVKERHAYILGLPLTKCDDGASPLVIWEGSHHIMRAAFDRALGGVAQAEWADINLTDTYQAARREVFRRCARVRIPAQPGQAYLLHRFALHGVAPWETGAKAPAEGRMIAYFRPDLPAGTDAWLRLP